MDQSQNATLAGLPDEVRRLTAATQQVATSLASLQELYAAEIARAQQERGRWAEKHKEMDELSAQQKREMDRLLEPYRRSAEQKPNPRRVLLSGGLVAALVALVTALMTVVQLGVRQLFGAG
jgi:hypothetical protein